MSLRFRLLLGFSVFFLSTFLFLADWLRDELRDHYAFLVEDQMVDFAYFMASVVENESTENLQWQDLKQTVERYKGQKFNAQIFGLMRIRSSYDVYLTDEKGIVQYSSRPDDQGKDYSQWNDVFLTLQGKYGSRSTHTDPDDPNSSIYFVSAPIKNKGKIIGVLSVIKSETNVLAVMSRSFTQLFWGLIGGFAIILILGFMITIWFTRPLNKLREYSIAVADGKRIPPPRFAASDLRDLLSSIEYLRTTIDGKKKMEHYTQTLTHEIKSPLTAIKGAAELACEPMSDVQRNKFLGNIVSETEKAHMICEQLLSIARLESQNFVQAKVKVRISDLLQRVEKSLAPLLNQKNMVLKIEVANEDTILGDSFLLEQAMRNLVQNSIDFSEAGSKIEVATHSNEHALKISVRDFGSGIPKFAEEKIYEKFFSLERPETGRKSTGLGLSLVQEVVSLHNGTFSLQNMEPGAQANLIFSLES